MEEKYKKMKEEFIDLLKSTNREGMDKLLEFLDNSDFYTAPSSTRFHGNWESGLLEHSLAVYKLLKEKVKNSPIELNVPEDTLIIVPLLHDICKTNFYKTDYRNAKNDLGVWEKVPYYTIDDTIPYGHGEKSVFLIERFMKLKIDEAMAIRWHMGGFDDTVKGGNYSIGLAYDKYPLAIKLFLADIESTYLREKGTSSVRN